VCLSSASFIDTADSYGPDVSEELIREALYPYDGILIAAKAGFRRPGLACGRRTACSNVASSTASASSRGACRRRACQVRLDPRPDRQGTRRGAESDRACLGAEAQSSDAADSRHLEGQHFEENVAAVDIQLSDEEYAALDREGRAEYAAA
jgi:hypothetical protein